jgi:hypothetical protein
MTRKERKLLETEKKYPRESEKTTPEDEKQAEFNKKCPKTKK